MFPTLYSIVGTRGAKVAEVWESSGDFGAWNVRFLRPLKRLGDGTSAKFHRAD